MTQENVSPYYYYVCQILDIVFYPLLVIFFLALVYHLLLLVTLIYFSESVYNADLGSIRGLGRSPGEGNGNPLSVLGWKIPWTVTCQAPLSKGPQESDPTWWLNHRHHLYYFTGLCFFLYVCAIIFCFVLFFIGI